MLSLQIRRLQAITNVMYMFKGEYMEVHGRISFYWLENVLYVEASGPFNEEGIINGKAEYLNVILERTCDYFSIIETWDDEALGSPLVMDVIKGFWGVLHEYNCLSIAVVVSNAIQQSVCQKLLPNIGEVFRERQDAKKWVISSDSLIFN